MYLLARVYGPAPDVVLACRLVIAGLMTSPGSRWGGGNCAGSSSSSSSANKRKVKAFNSVGVALGPPLLTPCVPATPRRVHGHGCVVLGAWCSPPSLFPFCAGLQDGPGVMSAREFVWWYNGHPDARALPVDLAKVGRRVGVAHRGERQTAKCIPGKSP